MKALIRSFASVVVFLGALWVYSSEVQLINFTDYGKKPPVKNIDPNAGKIQSTRSSTVLIGSDEEYKKYYGVVPDPKIDWSKSSIFIYYLGMRMSTGYSVKIEKIQTGFKEGEGSFVEILYSTKSPSRGQIVGKAITYPMAIVKIDAPSKDIEGFRMKSLNSSMQF